MINEIKPSKHITSFIAPAKLNLFLHINARRSDGYHELETLFIFLNYGDKLTFNVTKNTQVTLLSNTNEIPNDDNLVIKAAKALQKATKCQLGADIYLEKNLPMGGGVGGGSSDAATTLLVLNQLWQTNLSITQLCNIGIKLGADVPVFIKGEASIAQGVGEELKPINLKEKWYLVLHPNVHISTAKIFSHPDLPRNTPKLKTDWQSFPVRNDCEDLVKKYYPEVDKTLQWLLKYAPSKMTGTGACCFSSFETKAQAQHVLNALPDCWQGFIAKSAMVSPLHKQISTKKM
ncbi:4-diphosphocytidyl-2-C-methyl-D-erythritol kinase [Pseudoalteromonas denitrificans DSM 6059]|uniref:4-diphosphocytidyl-2-C-methyl-D-erythritol kinase n=2 Tax=Pseudoalteromonas TaxID=53246 RepID=A0A1I1TJ05_9GAMM|nr:4-diphosphocytidyl-2-C-methyl-D-erythritol kinase [Pseudoalteromonas denitrificans DSM 6059]